MCCLLQQSPKFYNNVYLIVGSWTFPEFIKLNVQMFQPLIKAQRRDYFLHYYRGCRSIYLPLSYPFRSLHKKIYVKKKKCPCRWKRVGYMNGYIITWMLHKMFMYSDKLLHAAGSRHPPPLPHPLLTYWMNKLTNKYGFCLRQIFPCHFIHV